MPDPLLDLLFAGDADQIKLNNQWLRWTNRHAKTAHIRQTRGWALLLTRSQLAAGHIAAFDGPVDVTAQLTTTTRRFADCDAIALTTKHLVDGIIDAGFLPDDSPKWVRTMTYLAPVNTGERGIRIQIRPTQNDET